MTKMAHAVTVASHQPFARTSAQTLELKTKRRPKRFNFPVLTSMDMSTVLGDECVPIENLILLVADADDKVRQGKGSFFFFSLP